MENLKGVCQKCHLICNLVWDHHTLLQRWPLLCMCSVPWRSSWFLPWTDGLSSSAHFNRMTCGLMILRSLAPGEPPYCFDMGSVQSLAPVRSEVLTFLYSSLSKKLGSRWEKQLLVPTSTAELVQDRNGKDPWYSHPLSRDEWWCCFYSTFFYSTCFFSTFDRGTHCTLYPQPPYYFQILPKSKPQQH